MILTVDVDPVLFHLGPVAISWYGLAVAAGMFAGVWLARREAGRRGLPVGRLADLTLWVVLGGLVGARLLHVIDRWDLYRDSPAQILAIQNGGLAILGGVLGGTLAGAIAALRWGLPLGAVSDAAAPGALLGQAIGRLGCLVTGDAVGLPTDGSWGIVYVNPGAMAPTLGIPYEPVFLYELLWDLGVLAVIWSLRRRPMAPGRLFALYLGLYATGKFAVTFLRTETVWLGGLQEAQLLALAAGALAVAWAAAAPRLQARPARQRAG